MRTIGHFTLNLQPANFSKKISWTIIPSPTEVSDLNMGKALTKMNVFNAGLIDLGQNT
jgi:hypothetical protein